MAPAFTALKAGATAALKGVLSAAVWFFLTALVGSLFLVVGVYTLAGTGAALIAAAAIFFVTATLLLIGMTRGG